MELNRENKAELLFHRLRERLESMSDGESFPSVRQIMQEYQVSRFTVDPVLRKLREQGLLEAVVGSGMFVRHPVAEKQPGMLILEPDWESPSIRDMSSLLAAQARKHNFEPEIRALDHREDFCRMLPELPGGVIVANSLARNLLTADQVRALVNAPTPCILCLNAARVDRVRFVNGNNFAAGMMAANYFFRCGYRRMGFLRTEPHGISSDDLIEGFQLAAGAFGCSVGIFDCGTRSGEDSSERTRDYLARHLDRICGCDALLVGSNLPAIAAMGYLEARGVSIPEELGILALGDSKISHAEQLSVVAAARSEIAAEVVEMASDILNRRFDRKFQIEISPRIIERGSTQSTEARSVQAAYEQEVVK